MEKLLNAMRQAVAELSIPHTEVAKRAGMSRWVLTRVLKGDDLLVENVLKLGAGLKIDFFRHVLLPETEAELAREKELLAEANAALLEELKAARMEIEKLVLSSKL
jgi:predicted transcriptional regulator